MNEIEFSVTPNAGAQVGNITLEQSPDFNGGEWNGSTNAPFSMTLSWAGGEMATLSDPNNQLNIADGTSIASGTTITANNVETLQANDSWSIEFPEGVEILTVNFLSGGNTAFNVEYLSFAASLDTTSICVDYLETFSQNASTRTLSSASGGSVSTCLLYTSPSPRDRG